MQIFLAVSKLFYYYVNMIFIVVDTAAHWVSSLRSYTLQEEFRYNISYHDVFDATYPR